MCKESVKIFNKENSQAYFFGYSMLTIWGFDYIENKHTLYPGKYCMENFVIL